MHRSLLALGLGLPLACAAASTTPDDQARLAVVVAGIHDVVGHYDARTGEVAFLPGFVEAAPEASLWLDGSPVQGSLGVTAPALGVDDVLVLSTDAGREINLSLAVADDDATSFRAPYTHYF